MPKSVLKSSSGKYFKIISNNDYYYYLGEFLNTGSFSAFFLENTYLENSTIIYRDNNSGNLKGGTKSCRIASEIPSLCFPRAVEGRNFVSLHFREKVILY